MRHRAFLGVFVLTAVLLTPARAAAAFIAEFNLTSPAQITYVQDVDFSVATLSGSGDVTARLSYVDITYPYNGVVNGTTSGCEAADFAGFAVGSIALLQRGTCTFAVKVQNAAAAGAAGVIIFNEGGLDPARHPLFTGTLSSQAFIPVIFTSYELGGTLWTYIASGAAVAHLKVQEVRDTEAPEPGTLALLLTGGAIAGWRRRHRA